MHPRLFTELDDRFEPVIIRQRERDANLVQLVVCQDGLEGLNLSCHPDAFIDSAHRHMVI